MRRRTEQLDTIINLTCSSKHSFYVVYKKSEDDGRGMSAKCPDCKENVRVTDLDEKRSVYLRRQLEGQELKKYIDYCVKVLRPRKKSFDAIAFRGVSGSLVAPSVAATLGKNLIIVRKSAKDNHSNILVEGHLKPQKYIIIDDFCDSGKTLKVIKMRAKSLNEKNECVGVLLYRATDYCQHICDDLGLEFIDA